MTTCNNANVGFTGHLLCAPIHAPSSGTQYRGMDRPGPEYAEAGPEHDLFLRLVTPDETIERELFIASLEEAKDVQRGYREIGQEYELLECTVVTSELEKPTREDRVFLGYDVCDWFIHSLMQDGIPGCDYATLMEFKRDDLPYWPILFLEYFYFQDKLNEHGLFARYEEASLFLEVERYLVQQHPDLEELDTKNASVFALSVVV